jgi:uncharacterized membrane protein
MGKDVSDVIGNALGNAAREAVGGISKGRKHGGGSLSGAKGIAAGGAAGLGLMALAPLAKHGVSKLAGTAGSGVEKVKDASVGKLKDASEGVIDDAKSKVKGDIVDAIPGSGLFSSLGGGGDDDDEGDSGGGKNSAPGAGKGRRMPVQQDMDIGVPIETVYNQWTQFEEWPKFMHRVQSASQEDEAHVAFKAKIWGKTKEFTAEIVEQRPEERIEWKVTEGISHTGVITFHELGPRLTRIEVNLDLEPGSLIEKAARGMRFVKRAVRADMARFKAYVLMQEEETGEWRGTIEDGEVKSQSSSSGSRSRSRGSADGDEGSSEGEEGSSSGGSRTSSRRRSRASSGGRSTRSSSNGGGGSSSSRSRSSRSSSNGGSASSSGSRGGSSGSGSSRRRSGSRS